MHLNAALLPLVAALMFGVVLGSLSGSPWVAALGACVALALIAAADRGQRE